MKRKLLQFDISVGFIIDKNKRVLLQKKDSGYHWNPNNWCLFGGKIEENETPEEAFDREISEEFSGKNKNLLSDVYFLFDVPYKTYSTTKNVVKRGNLKVFHALFIGEISDIEVREGSGFAFFEKEELYNLKPIIPECKKAILKALAKLDI